MYLRPCLYGNIFNSFSRYLVLFCPVFSIQNKANTNSKNIQKYLSHQQTPVCKTRISPFLKCISQHPYIWLVMDPIYANISEYTNITESMNFWSSDDFRGNRN